MNKTTSNSLNTSDSLFEMPLDAAPNTQVLQSRILEQTKNMAQTLDQPLERSFKVRFLNALSKPAFGASVAVAASVLLMTVFWVPNITNVENVQELVLDDLNFEEAMLLHDELMFAQL